LIFHPILAVMEILTGDWVVTKLEAATNRSVHDVYACELNGRENFWTNDPSHLGTPVFQHNASDNLTKRSRR
jgi:hypothetical protein